MKDLFIAILLTASAAALVLLTGCTAVAPTVQYRELHSSEDMQGMADAFALQASSITVAQTRTAAASLKVSSVRKGSAIKYGIRPVSSWRADTTVNLSKVANTDVVSKIGVDTQDDTVKAIGQVGGAFVKLAALATLRATEPALPAGCTLPMTIEVLSRNADGLANEEISPRPDCVSVVLGPVPVDAAPRASMPVDQDTSNFYYAACRDATVTVTGTPTRGVAVVRVADPRFVEFVRLPSKGAVAMHDECGVSVLSKEAAGDSSAAIVGALAGEAKAIRAAVEKLDD